MIAASDRSKVTSDKGQVTRGEGRVASDVASGQWPRARAGQKSRWQAAEARASRKEGRAERNCPVLHEGSETGSGVASYLRTGLAVLA
jgi:hypothetical protein